MENNSACILLYNKNEDQISELKTLIKDESDDFILFDTLETNIDTTLKNHSIDLIVFDIEDIKADLEVANTIIKNKDLENISILFTLEAKDVEYFFSQNFDLLRVDYLIKPLPNRVLTHKISLFAQNIIQKKATEYLVDAYEQNVIASKTDKRGIITYSSKAFCEICGYTQDELIGRSHNIIRHPEMSSEIYKDMWSTIKMGKAWKGEIKNKTKDDGYYWVDVVITPDFDYKGDITGYTSIRQDITSKKYIEQITITDHLTKVYNRKFFDESMEKEIYSAQRYNYPLALIILDIDYFKKINDTYGHAIGDIVLKEFSKLLKNNSRKSDIISRIGGEEFTIIVSNEDITQVERFGEKIRKIIQSHNFDTVGNITTSIGIAKLDENDTAKTLFKKADNALYEAKKTGRDQVKIFNQ